MTLNELLEKIADKTLRKEINDVVTALIASKKAPIESELAKSSSKIAELKAEMHKLTKEAREKEIDAFVSKIVGSDKKKQLLLKELANTDNIDKSFDEVKVDIKSAHKKYKEILGENEGTETKKTAAKISNEKLPLGSVFKFVDQAKEQYQNQNLKADKDPSIDNENVVQNKEQSKSEDVLGWQLTAFNDSF